MDALMIVQRALACGWLPSVSSGKTFRFTEPFELTDYAFELPKVRKPSRTYFDHLLTSEDMCHDHC